MQTHKKGITSMQAIERFGATRLSDIIYRLKKLGLTTTKRHMKTMRNTETT